MRSKLRLLFFILFLLPVTVSWAQSSPCPVIVSNTITVGPSAIVCPGRCAQVSAHATTNLPASTNYRVDSFAYQPYSYNTGTIYRAPFDDDYGGVVHLPFPFCFYGNTYSDITIGTNGQICFDTSLANGYCPYAITSGLPGNNNNATKNCIMGAYYDLYYVNSGTIYYATYGTAPCRVFVVSCYQVPLFQCTSLLATQQIVIHESTNQIDVNIAARPICSTWQNGLAILGIEDATGTNFVTAPGKNGTAWFGQNESYSFIPSGSPTGGARYQWSDHQGNILGNSDTLTVCPTTTTTYLVQATVYSGCDSFILTDSQTVFAYPLPTVNFTDNINYGCTQDTVLFTNQTVNGSTYRWTFGDNGIDTATNPTHIYTLQDTFKVGLIATSPHGCVDSTSQDLILEHPLKAAFTVDKDSICQGNTVTFTDKSTFTTQKGNPSYYWNFGDGSTDTVASPTHIYTKAGEFRVTMGIRNFIPCSDTTYALIHVDTVTFISVTQSDSVLCQGNAVTFHGVYSTLGNTGTVWNFGDGTIINNENDITHAFAAAGNYTITFTANYRICPDTTFPKYVTVYNYPTLNLGPDTSLCPGNPGIPINDFINAGNPKASWLWSTGDTTSGINVSQPGIYYTTVNVNGCTTSDSVWIKNDCYVNIPNVFSPNNDGVNDYFFPRQLLSNSITKFEMTIYNRWGQEIFYTQSINGRGWDGKLSGNDQPTGVYIYIINATLADGTTEHHQGNVTLLR